MLDPMSLEGMFAQYGRSLLWAITAAVGFGLGVGISLKVFAKSCDLLKVTTPLAEIYAPKSNNLKANSLVPVKQ